jgi:hypothetical protein
LGFTITSLNAAGLMMVLFLLASVGLIHLLFTEPVVVNNDLDELLEKKLSWFEKVKSIASVASVSLAACLFVSSMNQLALETSLPPITLLLWQFGQLDNSLVYTSLAAYLVCWYVVLGFCLTKKLSDRVLLFIAWCCVGAGTIFLVVVGFIQSTW